MYIIEVKLLKVYIMAKINFELMSKEEALEYCYRHENEFKRDAYACNENGERCFACLIEIINGGTIQPKDLPKYGMNYDEN